MTYFICRPSGSKWHITPANFIAKLLARWPEARVRERGSDPISHDWKMQMPGGEFEGRFHREQSGVAMNGAFEDCVNFVLWFRSLVPPTEPLFFFDDGMNVEFPVTVDTTAEEIKDATEKGIVVSDVDGASS